MIPSSDHGYCLSNAVRLAMRSCNLGTSHPPIDLPSSGEIVWPQGPAKVVRLFPEHAKNALLLLDNFDDSLIDLTREASHKVTLQRQCMGAQPHAQDVHMAHTGRRDGNNHRTLQQSNKCSTCCKATRLAIWPPCEADVHALFMTTTTNCSKAKTKTRFSAA